jgi:type I restriction-modification system DNA methylase subunit
MARKKHEQKTAKNGANFGFEQTLWQAADKLRGNMDASDYKRVVLGLIFFKHISDAFEERHAALKSEPHADPEDRDEYSAENVFWVPNDPRTLSKFRRLLGQDQRARSQDYSADGSGDGTSLAARFALTNISLDTIFA